MVVKFYIERAVKCFYMPMYGRCQAEAQQLNLYNVIMQATRCPVPTTWMFLLEE